jgi:hypothetical protein
MKKLTVFFAMAVFMVTFASYADASWQVDVFNNTDQNIHISVYGEHLFWRQVDCKVDGRHGQLPSCVLPGLICPAKAKVEWKQKTGPKALQGLEYTLDWGGARCWNINLKAEYDQNGEIILQFQ